MLCVGGDLSFGGGCVLCVACGLVFGGCGLAGCSLCDALFVVRCLFVGCCLYDA